MSVLDTVYSYGSGKVLFHCFNAIAMMFRSGLMEALIDLSLVLSLAFVGFQAAFGKDKTGIYVRWFMTYLVVVLALVQPRSIFQDGGMTIHIRDIITKKAYKVDHLPPGLVLPASVISGLGFALTQSFEQVFSHDDPTYLPYHRYGTLFGSQVMSELRNFKIQDPVFAENMEGYISNCMMYDVMIGRKYDITELRMSRDIWKLITDNASNLRMFNYRYPGKGGRKLVTCKAGITEIASFFKGEESALAKKFPIFSSVSSQNAKGGIIKSLELSSRFYDNLSVNGSDQLRQILLINAFKDTPASYGKLRGLQQQNSSWKFTGELAGITLPVMHSLFQAILYSVFPIIVGLVFFSERYSVLKRYFEMMVWIELWPILFAILNLIISVHSKSAGFSDITIGSIENITSTQSSYALAASSLSLMIPTFAYMIAKGGVSSFVHMAGSVMASSASGSSFASQEVISGNRSFDNVSGNNQSFNNLHSNKVNTSGELVSGHMRQSLADGTMQTDFLHMPSASSRIFQGGIGLSSSGGMTSINIGSHIQEGLQRQVQESSSIVASESKEISRIKQQMERQSIDYLASAGESESRGEHHSWNTSTREGEMMQSAMRQMKELHDNYNYSWHQSAERVLNTNITGGLDLSSSGENAVRAKGTGRATLGGDFNWKNSDNDAQDISENKSVSSSDDVQNFIESVALASKDLNYSNSQSNEMRLSKDLNISYEELKSHRENLALHTNKMHQAQESLDMSASNTASWNRSSYDDTLTFIANKLDPNKGSLERIGINRAREIIEQGGPELQSYVTELAGRKLQEMRMPNHYMMESRYDALSNQASASAATIDSALHEKMENNIGLGNMANDFRYLEEQGRNKLSGSDIQKTRDDLADRAAGIVESKIDSIGKTGHALKEEVNKAEDDRMLKKYIGRENKNDGSWSG